MNFLVCAFVCMSLGITVYGNDCPPFDSDVQTDTCSFKDGNGDVLSVPATNCSLYTDTHCCFDGKICYNKRPGETTSSSDFDEKDAFKRPTEELRRFLGGCTSKTFPDICQFPKGSDVPYVYEPPTEIPYCVRLPCSLNVSMQAELDSSIRKCGVQPGCYFDKELAVLREEYGESVLPGVPICHFAIRAPAFHTHAVKVIEKFGFWNPYFTNCLLEEFKEEIDEEPIGCKFIPYMETFGVKPKLSGWANINSRNCRLIGGCWRDGDGCYYPAEIKKVDVKSGQNFNANPLEMRYGRPRCRPFDSANPLKILRSVHECLASGCSVDPAYSSAYFPLMYKIGEKMPNLNDHWEYWDQVKAGKLSAKDIFDGIRWKWNDDFQNDFKLDSLKSTSENIALAGAQNLCDPVIGVIFGRRPCSPPYFPPPTLPTSCPFISRQKYSSLKGILDNCCDVNTCYLSKRDIRQMHSGPSYYYTEWGEFGVCSASIGNGVSKRQRKCISQDKSLCTETEEETKLCGNWGSWGGWGSCSPRFCGTRQRSRQCSTGNALDCKGSSKQVQRCFCWNGK